MKKILAILALVLVTGCATRGTNFNMADVDAFEPGVTTLDDAKAKLGKPRGMKEEKVGEKHVLWVYATPVGGRGVKLLFDKDDKFVRVVSRSDSQ